MYNFLCYFVVSWFRFLLLNTQNCSFLSVSRILSLVEYVITKGVVRIGSPDTNVLLILFFTSTVTNFGNFTFLLTEKTRVIQYHSKIYDCIPTFQSPRSDSTPTDGQKLTDLFVQVSSKTVHLVHRPPHKHRRRHNYPSTVNRE